jgi:hypothetical protein
MALILNLKMISILFLSFVMSSISAYDYVDSKPITISSYVDSKPIATPSFTDSKPITTSSSYSYMTVEDDDCGDEKSMSTALPVSTTNISTSTALPLSSTSSTKPSTTSTVGTYNPAEINSSSKLIHFSMFVFALAVVLI